MYRSFRARRWARLLGAAVLGGVLTAATLSTMPASADDTGDNDGVETYVVTDVSQSPSDAAATSSGWRFSGSRYRALGNGI